MRCDDARTHAADHLAGALPAATAEELSDHVRTCPACAADFDGLTDTWRRLRTIPPARADSAAMRARFEGALAAEVHAAAARSAGRWRYAWQLAAAVALLVAGFGMGRETAPVPAAPSELAGLRAELREMRQMVTLSLLQQQSAAERLKGVTWTSRIEQPGNELTAALLDALMHDPNVNVRLATVDALRRFADREAVRRGVVEAFQRQTSALVQVALIDFVVDVNGREATEALRRIADDARVDEAVRARAALGLERLG
jgi:hypothetical protein